MHGGGYEKYIDNLDDDLVNHAIQGSCLDEIRGNKLPDEILQNLIPPAPAENEKMGQSSNFFKAVAEKKVDNEVVKNLMEKYDKVFDLNEIMDIAQEKKEDDARASKGVELVDHRDMHIEDISGNKFEVEF
jgi:hypothetical protein